MKFLPLVLFLAGSMLSGAAAAQAPAAQGGVIKPPAHVDPAMRVKPKAPAAMPTPVVKPPANVVPK